MKMREYKKRSKGEIFRPNVTVLKTKNGVITKIRVNGEHYTIIHPDTQPKRRERK